jgi:hypothetical protein
MRTVCNRGPALSHARHAVCVNEGSVGPIWVRLGDATQRCSGSPGPTNPIRRVLMTWTKPEAEVVAVTMEVTAYVATL